MIADLHRLDFWPVRKFMQIYCRRVNAKNCPIGDTRYKWLFLWMCQAIDKRQDWPGEAKVWTKKMALLACSKLSRDGAYLPIIDQVLKKVIAKRLFV